SALLYAQYSISRSSSLLVLASGYLFTALIIIPHALTFPGAFTPTGLIGANLQSAAWLFLTSHLVFPAVLLAYARLENKGHADTFRAGPPRIAIGVSAALVAVFVAGFTQMSIAGVQYLPTLMIDRVQPFSAHFITINILIILVAVLAYIELWSR